ncbi:MAG: GWxTD domain-containing protein [Bacteroidota bacterium]
MAGWVARAGTVLMIVWMIAGSAYGQSLLQRGQAAYQVGEMDEAIALFQQIDGDSTTVAEAHFWLARAYMELAPPDLAAARRAIGRARKADTENRDYRAMSLLLAGERRWRVLPIVKEAWLRLMARLVIRQDSANAFAHYLIGDRLAAEYDALHEGIGFKLRDDLTDFGSLADVFNTERGEGELPTNKLAESTRQVFGNDTGLGGDPLNRFGNYDRLPIVLDTDINDDELAEVEFMENYVQGRPLDAVSKQQRALVTYRQAKGHLMKALRIDPYFPEAYASLSRLIAMTGVYKDAAPMLAIMEEHYTHDPNYWLLKGFFAVRDDRLRDGEAAFARAEDLMNAEDWAPYVDPGWFADDVAEAESYWDAQDERMLTATNERRAHHIARMIYADLRFGSGKQRGWETHPGEIVARYGEPIAEVRFQDLLDHYMHWVYDSRLKFTFMDLGKAGRFTFFSPKSQQMAGEGEQASRVNPWKVDATLRARELIQEEPERLIEMEGTTFPHLAYQLRGEAGQADVWIPVGIPVVVKPLGLPFRGGAYLVAEATRLEAQAQVRGVLNARSLARRYAEGQLVVHTHALSAAPGSYELAIEFDVGETSQAYGHTRRPLQVRTFGDKLALSDLVLAYMIEEGDEEDGAAGRSVTRDGVTLDLAPWGVFQAGDPLYLYFETYNLARQPDGTARYDVEAVIVKDRRGGGWTKMLRRAFSRRAKRRGVSVSSTRTLVPGEPTGDYLLLDTSGQAPGTYAVVVKVTDKVTGKSVRSGQSVMLQ